MTSVVVPTVDADLLAGMSHLPAGRSLQLRSYLARVMEARRSPLHLNSLASALLLGWDPELGGYPARSVDASQLPQLRHGAPGDHVPVGALACQPTETAAGVLVFEVLASYGRLPLSDPWDPVAPDPDIATVCFGSEDAAPLHPTQLVIDLDAVPELTRDRLTDARRQRLRQRGRWLSRLGHLHSHARGPATPTTDQRQHFPTWLVGHHGGQLSAWLGEVQGREPGADELHAAVAACMATIEQVLTSTPRIVRHGDTFWTLDALQQSLDDPDELLGRARIESLGRIVASTYGHPVRYTALGWEIERMAAEYDLDVDQRDRMLVGPAYLRAVFTATHLLVQELAGEQVDGVLSRGDQTLHVRVDDASQWGGLWRAEQVDHAALPWYATYPIDQPLQLGPQPAASGEHLTARPEPAATRHPDARDAQASTGTDRIASDRLTDRDVTWSSTLQVEELIAGTLALSDTAARALPTGPVTVTLIHETGPPGLTDTHVLTWLTQTRRGTPQLRGIGWPARLQVGTILHGQVTHGITEITLHTRRLTEPVDGIEHEHDAEVHRAALHHDASVRQ